MRVALIGTSARVEDSSQHASEHLFKYSGGNTGNFAYIHGLCSQIASEFDLLPWHVRPEIVRESYDVVVIACANQLGPHTDLGNLAEHLEKIDLPTVAIGLGAQAGGFDKKVTLTEGTKRWIQAIASHAPSSAPNIGVRGEFSRLQLEHYGFGERAAITGCPSNFINPDPELPSKLMAKFESRKLDRVAVPAGLHLWAQLKDVERQLADLVEETTGSYIAQSELDMIRLTRGEFDRIEASTLASLNAYIRPNLSLDEFVVWCKRHAVCFIDATSWLEAMRNFDFVVGPRFHGVMLAIQAGTPGGVIAHDSRTYEMCETMCIPVRHYTDLTEGVTKDNLRSLFKFDSSAYRQRRRELGARYIDVLSSAGVQVKAGLSQLLETAKV
jgi:hypothetical protein